MKSRIYECLVMHARFRPRAHRFVYRLFMLALDLDELPDLDRRLRLFSVDRANIFSFRQQDFLPLHDTPHNLSSANPLPLPVSPSADLKARVLTLLAAHDIDPGPSPRVELITLPRMLGYLFNPVAFYFIADAAGRPVAAIPEVTNTFREMKPWVLGPASLATTGPTPAFRLRAPKQFYVSPFSDVDVAFDFHLCVPGERLAVQIDDYEGPHRTLTSTLTGPTRPLTDATLAWFLLKYPFLTLRVIALIHWHALRLWLKKVPWFDKAARPEAQQDLYHPHPSIAPRSETSAPKS